MSELDKWFPRQAKPQPEIVAHKTRFPHVAERVRPILDRMMDIWEAEGRQANRAFVATWPPAANDYVDQVDEDPDLFEQAMRLMLEKGLMVKSPRSMVAVALELKAKKGPSFSDYEPCAICGAVLCKHMAENNRGGTP